MPVLWTLSLLLSLSLPVSLRAFTLTREGATEPPLPVTDTGEGKRGQTSYPPVGVPVAFKMAASPSRLLDWFTPASEETEAKDEFRGIIGEYADTLDSSESSPYPSETRPEALSSTEIGATSQTGARSTPGTSFRDGQPHTNPERAPGYGPTENSGRGASEPSPPPPQDAPTPSAPPDPQNEATGIPSSLLPRSSAQTEMTPGFNPSPSTRGPGTAAATARPRGDNGNGSRDLTDEPSNAGTVGAATVKELVFASPELRDSGANGTPPDPDSETADLAGVPCNASDRPWKPAYPDDSAANQSLRPTLVLTPPLFVPLHSDWNAALATWGLVWEAHIYGLASVFAAIGAISALCLLGLPLRCPPGSPYFTLLHLLLLATGGVRAFSLIYDAYGHRDRLPPLGALLLSDLPLPCLASAFSLSFFLLSQRSRMCLSLRISLSAPLSGLPRPGLLLVLALLHFGASLGCAGLLELLPGAPALLLLPQGVFVGASILLPCCYLIFYCHVRAETRHIYRLSDGGGGGSSEGSPEACRPARCPFSEAGEWGRAAGAGVGGSLCLLGCGGLQLYGMLHALGLGGVGAGAGFRPWPWLGYQLGCRLCEVGACLALSLVGTQPLLCRAGGGGSSSSPRRTKLHPRPGSWSRLPCVSPCRGPAVPSQGEAKSPVLPPHYPWSPAQQEKLVVCEVITKSRSEDLPLYTLAESPRNGLDPASRPVQSRSSVFAPLPNPPSPPGRPRGAVDSHSSRDSLDLYSDSTVDLRPPSPIDLSRSIDQALFSETLFPHGLFHPPRLFHASSSLSLTSPGHAARPHADSPLYRTSSCGDVDQDDPLSQPRPPKSPSSSPDHWGWKGSGASCGSSQGLCSSSPREKGKGRSQPRPAASRGQQLAQSSVPRAIPHLPHHRRYRTLSSASRDSRGEGGLAGTEDLSESRQLERDLAVQAEFINVCRQIDSLSVCSDTIDL